VKEELEEKRNYSKKQLQQKEKKAKRNSLQVTEEDEFLEAQTELQVD